MLLLYEEVDLAVVDDDEPALVVLVLGGDAVLLFVDGADELEGYLVLEVDGEVGEEEDALLYDADVGLVDEVLPNARLHVLQELGFLDLLERGGLLLVVLVLDVALHLLTQLLAQRVVVPQLGYGLLVVVVLLVLHVALVDDAADDADHVPEEGSAAELNQHHDDDFRIILGSYVSEADSYGGGHSPVDRVDVLDHQRFAGEGEVGQVDPPVAPFGRHVDGRVQQEALGFSRITKMWASRNRKQKSSTILSSLMSFFSSAYILAT